MAGAAVDGAQFISREAPGRWPSSYPDLLRPAPTRREEAGRPRYPLIRRRVPFLGWQLYRYRFFTRPAVSSACNPDFNTPVETLTPPGGGGGKRTRVRRSSAQSVYMLVQPLWCPWAPSLHRGAWLAGAAAEASPVYFAGGPRALARKLSRLITAGPYPS